MTKTKIQKLSKISWEQLWGLTHEEGVAILRDIKQFLEQEEVLGHKTELTITEVIAPETFDFSLIIEWWEWVG